jgi:hypothetical protein
LLDKKRLVLYVSTNSADGHYKNTLNTAVLVVKITLMHTQPTTWMWL